MRSLRFPQTFLELQRFLDLFRIVKFAMLIANCDNTQVKIRDTLRNRSGFTMRTQWVLRKLGVEKGAEQGQRLAAGEIVLIL